MTTPRHTVHIGQDRDGFTVQAHRWVGDELVGSGAVFHRPTLTAARVHADDLVQHRLACGWPCVLTIDETLEAAS